MLITKSGPAEKSEGLEMNKTEKYLRVTCKSEDDGTVRVSIDGDYEGLLLLKSRIDGLLSLKESILKEKGPQDIILMSREWAGELSNETPLLREWKVVDELRIYRCEHE